MSSFASNNVKSLFVSIFNSDAARNISASAEMLLSTTRLILIPFQSSTVTLVYTQQQQQQRLSTIGYTRHYIIVEILV